ncbi:uncharacterized protein M6B38_297580 [Iris pallida]|uniref:OBG-type G domain-containing protein n=1 Tax=Iris pallida TaxID=29817 RepID=A0AAX6HR96_IRIPA|nr:uncharacterized protein M6B38_297580 [Iris pallida]
MATARVLSLGFSSSSSFSASLILPRQWCRLYSAASRTSMSLKAVIIGLPNVGKSTLFNDVGLGNKFLSHILEVDSILQVVRCFEDDDIVHVNGKVDPKSDIDVINLELVFSNLDQIEKRLDKLKKSKAKDSQSKVKEEAEKSSLESIQEALMDRKPARSVPLTDLEKDSIHQLCLLTMEPVIYVANVAETDLAEPSSNPHVR